MLQSPSAERNKDPILAVLRRVLPESGLVLEIASGTGQHVVHFARALPDLEWQPSEPDAEMRRSIADWTRAEALANVRTPLDLDVMSPVWPIARADAVLCLNMIHIAPWAATLRLIAGASRLLPDGAVLLLYGPFRCGGTHTAPSNAAFDAELRRHDPTWGVRDLEAVAAVAAERGLALGQVVEMPANNLSLMLRVTAKSANP